MKGVTLYVSCVDTGLMVVAGDSCANAVDLPFAGSFSLISTGADTQALSASHAIFPAMVELILSSLSDF